MNPTFLKGLQWRNVGPFRGGRVSAVSGVVGEPGVYYIGLPRGGVWKTTSAGQTWFPVFDSIKETSCIGALAVAPSDHDVVYAGSGDISGNGEGWGLYKSSDAGTTWQHLGLQDTKIISSILVDPKDPNIVLLSSAGPNTTQSEARGVFRSEDGGKTWRHTLSIDNETGVAEIGCAYDRPQVILASTLHYYRAPNLAPNVAPKPHPGSLYKSVDEGITWKKLDGKGLPALNGRFTVAVAQNTEARRMFVIGQFGLYRSDDGGDTWQQMAEKDARIANGQGNYSCGVFVDTKNPDILYTVATCVYRSTDGGRNFTGFKGAPGGDDPHDIWIDPTDSRHILLGGDQGAVVSLDSGATWGSWYNQPTGQVYKVATDNQFPYWVYATQQDSGAIGTSTRGNLGEITPFDWATNPGFEVGSIVVDPANPKVTYSGSFMLGIGRFNAATGEWVEVGPAVNAADNLRFNLLCPIVFSHYDRGQMITGTQYLMATKNGGMSWQKLSPDLAVRSDIPDQKVPDGAPLGALGAQRNGSIQYFAESTARRGVIWVGTTNGLVQMTKDGGSTWTNVTPKESTTGLQVWCLDTSAHDPATAFVGFLGLGIRKPVLYRTRDFGKTWESIVSGLPTEAPFESGVQSLRCDPVRKGLVYLAIGRGVYVSFDDGDHWQSLMLNLPATVMTDLIVHGNDLVLGTYGRGVWILDDISPLREISPSMESETVHLYKPGPAIRVRRNTNGDTPFPPEVPHAMNPPLGATIYYSLASKPAGPVTLDVLDSKGTVVRHMTSEPSTAYADPDPAVPRFWEDKRSPLPTEVGLNRVNWNIRYDEPPAFIHDVEDVMAATPGDTSAAVEGPMALPGAYSIRLSVDGKTFSQPLTVVKDPRTTASLGDLRKQLERDLGLQQCATRTYEAHEQVVSLRAALKDALASPDKAVADAAKAYDTKLAAIEGKVSYERRFFLGSDFSDCVNANINLLQLFYQLDTGDGAPTEAVWRTYAEAIRSTQKLLDQWKSLNGQPLSDCNAALTKAGLKPVAAAPALGPLPITPAWLRQTATPGTRPAS